MTCQHCIKKNITLSQLNSNKTGEKRKKKEAIPFVEEKKQEWMSLPGTTKPYAPWLIKTPKTMQREMNDIDWTIFGWSVKVTHYFNSNVLKTLGWWLEHRGLRRTSFRSLLKLWWNLRVKRCFERGTQSSVGFRAFYSIQVFQLELKL